MTKQKCGKELRLIIIYLRLFVFKQSFLSLDFDNYLPIKGFFKLGKCLLFFDIGHDAV